MAGRPSHSLRIAFERRRHRRGFVTFAGARHGHSRPDAALPLLGKIVAIILVLSLLSIALESCPASSPSAGTIARGRGDVAANLASSQTVLGPIPRHCTELGCGQGRGRERKAVTERRSWKLAAAPASLDVAAEVALEPRYRGIFKVNGYVMKANLAATWPDGSALRPKAEHAGSRLSCEPPQVLLSLGDSRGVRSATVRVDGSEAVVLPGTGHPAHGRGFHVAVSDAFADASRPLSVLMSIELVGTGELAFAPVGESTRVALASDWPASSFAGRFLPLERTVDESLSRPLGWVAGVNAQEAAAGAAACAWQCPRRRAARRAPGLRKTFGVSFIDPVSAHAERSGLKYGLLFIA
jgi:inner membrane protein